ncbi:MAG TPA: Fe-S protein assembly co-chaperone HscB [Candidatus Kapabacteria bacterium]|jgi:molecular chaperone HscB
MTDHFCRFGIDRTFGVDADRLERRFHELQLQSHPDRHVGDEETRRDEALQESSDINAAYRTLREPIPRAKHLVELYGYPISEQKSVPPGLLMTVMEAQEKIAEFEAAVDHDTKQDAMDELLAIVEELEGQREVIDEEREHLARRWDIAMHPVEAAQLSAKEKEELGRMAQLISERAYLETLRISVDATRHGKPAFIQH